MPGLVLLVVSGIFTPAEAQFSNGFSYRREVDFVDAEVIGGPHANFPVLIDETLLDLRTTANGGKVENASGYDIIFTSDQAGSTQLAHEIEHYDAVTGEIVFWVRVESLAATTSIYLFYGNSSIATFQGDVTSNGATGVWDDDYKGVWHLHDDFLDATSNGNNGTNFGSTDIAGQIADGQGFDGSDDRIDVSHSASNNLSGDFTISLWVRPNEIGICDMTLSKGGTGNSGTTVIALKHECGGVSPKNRFWIIDSASNNIELTSSVDYTVGDWNYLVGTFDNVNLTLYHDGQFDNAMGATTGLSTNTDVWRIGRGTAGLEAYDGTIDEVRISSADRGGAWIETEFNNQDSPSTFYTLGAETDVGISGVVFEDVNYGGGGGRNLATAAADAPTFSVGRDGVTVELYGVSDNFLSSTITAVGGSYSFSGLALASYTVRVVNDTVTSSRPGSDGSELAVQTYRSDGVSEAAGDGAKKVGGERPSNEDAAANSGAQPLASLQGTDLDIDGVPEWTQSIVAVDASSGDVTGVDFGFNFDVVVNTNDAGQGSLRQFILNANLLE